jgi:CheY-like chemotaxis protein
MTIGGKEVLLVGQSFHGAQSLTERLNGWGFRCRIAGSMRAAANLLSAHRIHLVLSNTMLPDGTGFGLVEALAGRPVTAFLCLPVENSCLWLPAIDDGKECLGMPALRPSEFAIALEEMSRRLADPVAVN